ncbi:hypothetical protein GCM10017709_14590 [Glutamicibacter nicotianae]
MNMPERRTRAMQRVEELLHCPEARTLLTSYGWFEGTPVVFAQYADPVDEVMGFVSVHGRAVLMVVDDGQTDEPRLWHITVPSPLFPKVPPLPAGTTISELCSRRRTEKLMPFRVAFWSHSAAIHEIPCFVRSDWPGQVTPLPTDIG